jgi:2,4-diketo-3-deoxy-L-fuconate hydrolase
MREISNSHFPDIPRTVRMCRMVTVIGTFAVDERVFPGALSEGEVTDLTGVAPTVRDLIEVWDDALPTIRAGVEGPRHRLADCRVFAPLEPRNVIQAGANYRKHVIDLAVQHTELTDGRTVEQVRDETTAMMDERARTGIPYFFTGLPSAIAGPYDDVVLPTVDGKHDWELELAAVIGRPAFRVSRDDALDHVAAYTVVNDLTTRDLVFRRDMPEIGTDWFRAKNAPGFLPTGPYLVPRDLVADPSRLRITLLLNGEVMQDESTSDMIFDVAALVSQASMTARLLPGDRGLTGSPAGNGMHWGRLLRPGDVMEGTITGPGGPLGFGTQRTACVADPSWVDR